MDSLTNTVAHLETGGGNFECEIGQAVIVNEIHYRYMIIDLLRAEFVLIDVCKMCFESMNQSNTFTLRLVLRYERMNWSPQSGDLTPLYFSFCIQVSAMRLIQEGM